MLAHSVSSDSIPGKEVKKIEGEEEKSLKRSSSSLNFKKFVAKGLGSSSMKHLFKSKKPRLPADIVKQTRASLLFLHSGGGDTHKRFDKVEELDVLIAEMKSILYGNCESQPVPGACVQLTQEFFKDDTLRLLILCLPQLNFEVVARYVLKSEHMKKFFDYVQLPNFDVASDATATFKELMTRHKSTVAEFLSGNYSWFFSEFNSKLLESTNYMTRRSGVKLLGDVLLDLSNSGVMIRYVSSKDNMRVLMNLLRESHKSIQIDAFHVFKLFVANQNKPCDIVNLLIANRNKLLRFFDCFNVDREDDSFEAEKAQVVKEIEELRPITPIACSGE